ncbi:hypothetical protein AAC387_Pa02g1823 [Persea americana]
MHRRADASLVEAQRVKCRAEWRKKTKGGGATQVSVVAQVETARAKSWKSRGEEGKGEEERNWARWRPGGLRPEGGRRKKGSSTASGPGYEIV